MKLVVVESPYAGASAGDVQRNERYARACLADCLARGEAPYASHLLYTQPGVLDDTKSEERAKGIAAGFAWREMAAATVVYIDLGMSRGMIAGLKHAHEQIDSGDHGHGIEFRELGGEWAVQR